MSELHVVFGGNGGAGEAIIRELIARGKQVRIATRSGHVSQELLQSNVELMKADATDIASAKAACAGAAVVYHAAGVPYQQWYTQFPIMLDAIMAGAASASAKLVYVDNTYMYGKVSGPMTENTPYNATDGKGKLRGELANKLLQAHKDGKIRATIARGTNFYGPGIVNAVLGLKELKGVLQGKKAMWLARLDMPFSMTYVKDFAKGAVTLGERDEALGRAWHIPTAPALTGRQFLTTLFEEAQLPSKIGVYTRPMMQMLAPFNPLIREVVGTLHHYEAPYVLDSSAYIRTFGDVTPTLQHPALHTTLEWVRTEMNTPIVAAR